MALDFPASPIPVGTKWPNPGIVGVPVYTWDGQKWTTIGGTMAVGASPAINVPLVDATVGVVGTSVNYAREDHVHPLPADAVNKSYVDTQDALRVASAGDTMSGPLVLAGDPTANLQAATKQYVDNKPSAAQPGTAAPLVDAIPAFAGVATKYSREDHVHPTDTSRAAVSAIPGGATAAPIMDGNAAVGVAINYAREDHIHPTDTSRAAKSYVDSQDNALATAIPAGATVVPLPGATTGLVGASAKYAREDHVHPGGSGGGGGASLTVSDTPPAGAADGSLWWESDSGILFVRYNDGSSSQWVVASPQPDISQFLMRTGGQMQGSLLLAADPAAATEAATKQYVDAHSAPPAFPSGTVLLFYQASAPTGWTKITTQNDKGLRVVSGAGGVAGGTTAFSTVFSQTVVGNHTLTAAEQASMGVSGAAYGNVYGSSGEIIVWRDDASVAIGWSSGAGGPAGLSQGYPVLYNGSISGTASGSSGAHNHPVTLNVAYLDVILASKN